MTVAERERDRLTAEVEQLRAKIVPLIHAAELARGYLADVAGAGAVPNIVGFAVKHDAIYNTLANAAAVAKAHLNK